MNCKKVEARIECLVCGYPYSESMYPDSTPPLPCNTDDANIKKHVNIWEARYTLKALEWMTRAN